MLYKIVIILPNSESMNSITCELGKEQSIYLNLVLYKLNIQVIISKENWLEIQTECITVEPVEGGKWNDKKYETKPKEARN